MHTVLIVPLITGLVVTPVARPCPPESARLRSDTTVSKHAAPPLTMDLVRKIAAVQKALDELHRKHPEQAKKDSAAMAGMIRPDLSKNDTTLNMLLSDFKASVSPEQVAAMKKAGLTPDEFMSGTMRLGFALMIQTLHKAGMPIPIPGADSSSGMSLSGLPPELAASAAADIEFVSQHDEELEQLGFKAPEIPQLTPPTPSGADQD